MPYGMRHAGVDPETEAAATATMGAALSVHRRLGPGLLESVYRAVLAGTLRREGHDVAVERILPLVVDGERYEHAYRLDLVVDGRVVVELKTVEALHPNHVAQLTTYLRLSGCRVGLLYNFSAARLKDGIVRVVV